MNKIVELTKKPLVERGWTNNNDYRGYFHPQLNPDDGIHVGLSDFGAKEAQTAADQPLLWEEITRLENAMKQVIKLCAEVYGEGQESAVPAILIEALSKIS